MALEKLPTRIEDVLLKVRILRLKIDAETKQNDSVPLVSQGASSSSA